ncbi:MAG: hypothetical protein CMJ49_03375 [Planctomycetaceae bacterium]|nr:hypothetical protein [Planctomycetaceae bacterium]
MECNIDRPGRTVRMWMGIAMILIAVVCVVLKWTRVWPGVWPWVVGGLLCGVGLFSVVEGLIGWCAIRAMGFKTRI